MTNKDKAQNTPGAAIASHLIWILVFNILVFGLWYLIWAGIRIYKNAKAHEHNRLTGIEEMPYQTITWKHFAHLNNLN